MRKYIALISLIMALAMVFTGCGLTKMMEDQTVNYGDLTMTLPGYYQDYSKQDFAQNYSFVYGFSDVAIMGLREEITLFTSYDSDLTLEEYAQLVIDGNGLNCEVETVDGLITFSFTSENSGQTHAYLAAVYQSARAFWLIQIGCLENNYENNREKFINILKTVNV